MSQTINSLLPFEERHRPQRFSELVFANPLVAQHLEYYAQYQVHGNLLLYGPYGTAKSSTALMIVRERLIACGMLQHHVAKAHAQDLKGKVWTLEANIETLLFVNNADPHPYVIIDEIDQLSAKEQWQLRALLDKYAAVKIIATTNNLSDVDGGIRSRCDCLHVGMPQPQDWLSRAQQILALEGVQVNSQALLAVLNTTTDARDVMRALERLVLASHRKTNTTVMAPVVTLAVHTAPKATVPNAVVPNTAAAGTTAPNSVGQSTANTP